MTTAVGDRTARLGTLAASRHANWIVAAISVAAMAAFVVFRLLTWPQVDAPEGAAYAEGFIVSITMVDGDRVVRYGFEVTEGERVFDGAVIGETADPAYAWGRHTGGDLISVAYDPANPTNSVPYFAFPVWATGSWAFLLWLTLFWSLSWAKGRLTRSAEPTREGGV